MGLPYADSKSFECPLCHVHSTFEWAELHFEHLFKKLDALRRETEKKIHFSSIKTAKCSHCECQNYWVKTPDSINWQMIYPTHSTAPLPSPDIPNNCKNDYSEAAEIFQKSPRGAAALLRLCIQNLCIELGENGDLNTAIGNIVKNKGLNPKVQQALDIVRVIGNNAVHPGKIDVNDNLEVVTSLFKLVNLIVQETITTPREIEQTYNTLPIGALEAIKKRDKK